MPEHKILSSLFCHFLNPDSTQSKPGVGITKWQFKEFSYIKCQEGIPEITYLNVEKSCQVKSISAVPEKVDFNFSSYESLEPF